MEVQELRVGSLVLYGEKALQKVLAIDGINNTVDVVFAIDTRSSNQIYLDLKDIKPIQLTEEWLIKLGFLLTDSNDEDFRSYVLPGKAYKLLFCIKSVTPTITEGKIYCSRSDVIVEYVHQLQNLVFIIIGEELELKP